MIISVDKLLKDDEKNFTKLSPDINIIENQEKDLDVEQLWQENPGWSLFMGFKEEADESFEDSF